MAKSKKSRVPISVLLLLATSCIQEEQALRPLSANEEQLSDFISAVVNVYELPAIGVAVVAGDQIYSKVITKDEETNSHDADSTIFFMGNISELMVATTIAKLASDNKLNLDDRVAKHLPYFKLGNVLNKEITIRHLLTQTSGIPKHNAVWDVPYNGPDALQRTTLSVAEQQPEFIPGTKVKRSQYNFDILADIVRHVTDTSFQCYTKQNIFKPLKMHTSSFDMNDLPAKYVAKPLAIKNWLTFSRDSLPAYPYNPEHAGSIGYHATMYDVCKWMSALLSDGSFLTNAIRREMLSVHFKTGDKTSVGLGWEIVEDGKPMLYKHHNIGGFTADMIMIPEEKIGVTVVSNTSDEFYAHFITEQIIAWLHHKQLKAPKEPLHIEMARKFEKTKNIDSAFALYSVLREEGSDKYDVSEEGLSEFGVLLMHRLFDFPAAIRVFKFTQKEFPSSQKIYLNLAEAYLLQDSLDLAESHLDKAKGLIGSNKELTARISYLTEVINSKKEQRNYEHATVMAMPE